MNYKIDWCEKKAPDWIVANVTDEGGVSIQNVSINRKSKNGDEFSGFDAIMNGQTIEAQIWTSSQGKNYLFPPKKKLEPPKDAIFQKKGSSFGVKAAQERKAEMIEKAQERKNESIAYFNAVNSSISLLEAEGSAGPIHNENIKEFITYWRDWFLSEWQKYEASEETDKHNPF